MKGLRYIAILTAAFLLGVVPTQAQTEEEIDAAVASISSGEQYLIYTYSNGASVGSIRYYLRSDGYLTNDVQTAGIFMLNQGSGGTEAPGKSFYVEGESGVFTNHPNNTGTVDDTNNKHIYTTTSLHRADWETQLFYLDGEGNYAVRCTNATGTNWGPNLFWTVVEDNDEDGLPNATYRLEADYVWKIVKYEQAFSQVDLSPISEESEGMVSFTFGNVGYANIEAVSGYSLADSSLTSNYVKLSFLGANSPTLDPCPLDAEHIVLRNGADSYQIIVTPNGDNVRITSITFNASHGSNVEGFLEVMSGGGFLTSGNWISDGEGTYEGVTFMAQADIPDLEQIVVYYSNGATDPAPTSDEMMALIQQSVSTTVGINDALLQFNGEASDSLKQALMMYYPNGYQLEGIPFNFGAVTMNFEGGIVVLRVSPTGGDLEVAPMGPYVLRLNSASTMTDVNFISTEVGEYTMQSAGCVPSIFAGSGNEGSFTDNQWSGLATDLQFTMTESSPSFSAIHVSYGATLIQAMEPTFNYDETTHMLELMTTTDGATIYYTLDGSEPTTGSLVYEGPIYLSGNVYVRAIAGGDGFESSAVVEFINNDFTATPVTFFYDSQSRMMSLMSEMDGGATIFYTRDGSSPLDTLTAERYIEPFLINSAGDFQFDIQAFARRSGYNDSEVTVFTREGHITADPTFDRTDNNVTITCETAGATIYYSMDGSGTPTQIYESPVTFSENQPYGLQAQAVAPEMVPSYVVNYDIDWFKCGDVTFRVEDGQLWMESTTMSDGVQIYYTTNGTMPADTSSVYTTPIPLATLPQGAVINAIAMRMNWYDSEVTTFTLAEYQTATPQVAMADRQATVTCENADANIAYLVADVTGQFVPTSYEEILAMYQALVAQREDAMAQQGANLPEVVGGTIPSGSTIALTYNGILYVAAQAGELTASPVVAQPVTGIQAVAPTFDYAGLRLAMFTTTPGASIYYTTDGTMPNEGSTLYTEPVSLPMADATVMAIAANSQLYDASEVSTYNFVLTEHTTATPQFTREDNILFINSETPGAQIYYVIDEGAAPAATEPDSTSTLYTGPIQLEGNVTVRAIAYAAGYFPSAVNAYTASEFQCEAPAFALDGLNLIMTTTTPEATIYYTTDGTIPTTSSNIYQEPIPLTANVTFRAIAVRQGWTSSEVSVYEFVAADYTVGTPVVSRSGDYLTISSSTPGARFYYNTTGEQATEADTYYEGPFIPQANGMIQIIAVADSLLPSYTTYEVNWLTTSIVQFAYAYPYLTMTTASPEATIYYTLDGSEPTMDSAVYGNEPIELTVNTTVRAIAVRPGYNPSAVTQYIVDIDANTAAAPVLAREGETVIITTSTPGAAIHYTMDGSEPTVNHPIYTEPITPWENGLIRAMAVANGMANSAISDFFVDWFNCEKVTFAYDYRTIVLSTATDDAVIRYTLDGTLPSDSSAVYIEPLALTANTTVTAVAYREGYNPSEVTTYNFVRADHTCATPQFEREGNELTITSATEGAAINYSFNTSLSSGRMIAMLVPNDYETSADEADAVAWFQQNYVATNKGVLLTPANIDGLNIGRQSAVWVMCDRIGIERGWQNLPGDLAASATIEALKAFAADGGNLFLTNHATQLTVAVGRIAEAYAPGIYGNGEGGQNPDIWGVHPIIGNVEGQIYDHSGHDIYRGMTYEPGLYAGIYCFESDGFKGDHNCMWDLNSYGLTPNPNVVKTWEETTNSTVLGTWNHVVDYCCAGIVDFHPTTSFPARILAVGLAAYEWNIGRANEMQDQLELFTSNSLSYVSASNGNQVYSALSPVTITLDGNVTVRAFATRGDLFDSAVGTYTSSDFQVAGVTFVYEGLRLHMSTTTEGATIYYTTDGSVPTPQSTLYDQPVELTADCVVRAIAVREGWTTSAATTYNFSLAAVTCATPQFSRQGNEVIITTTTADAVIHYTLDGSDPLTGNYLEYTNPIHLDGNVTIRAIAVREDMYPSAISTYTASEFQVAAVTFSYSNLLLTMQTATDGASIYYTTDGSEPTVNSTYYQNPIELTADCVVRAIAVRESWEASEITEYNFSLAVVTVAKPQFSRNGNLLYITTATQGATIYYSTDGSEPNTVYTGAIQLDGNGFVLARATAEGYYDSEFSEYQVNWFKVADVDFVFSNLRLTMSTTTPDATIYFTIDGTEPTTDSNIYYDPIELNSNCVVQAIAVRENWQNSEVTSYEFNLDNVTADSPLISREGNLVTITNITEGTTVYYTTDGSTPTTASNEYTGPIQVTQNCMIRAIATGQNFNPSPVVSYTVDWFQAERVEFAYNELYLEMFTSTADATIYYTTDGSYPSETSNVFTEAIMLTEDCDVRAIAVRQGWNTSDVTLYHFTRAAVTAPTPQFYRNGNQLSITTGNQDVQVFYTLDGTEPSMDAIEYTGPLTLTENVTVRAIALNEHRYFPSAVNAYVVDWFKVSSVEFALNEMRLTLSTPTPEAKIYYTLDGTTPSAASVPYVAPLTLTADVDVRAIAVRQNWNDAPVSLYHFNLSNHTAPTPQFRRNGNVLSISSGVTDVEIRYTLDGSAPNANSELYSAPIQLTQNGVVRAIAMGHSYANSAIALYQVDWFRVAGVEFTLFGQELELHTSTDEAEIHYTIDGSQPTANSAIYSSPLLLTADADVRALAMRAGWTNSEVSLFQFRRASVTAATPNFSRSGNELVITTATADATIYYTTDGSVPTVNSAIYEGPIQLTQNCLVSAIAISEGTLQSGISTYVVNWFMVEDVTFTYAGGLLRMETATPDARIYYTIDGSQPTEQSTRYTSPISIEQSCVVHAIAVREDMQPSNISSYYFSLENPGAVTPIFELRDNGLLAIFSPTQGATIYYTMDGTMPTEQSTKYVTPIQLTRNCTVRAIAVAAGYRTSGVAEFTTDMFRVQPIRPELFEGFLYLATETPNAIIHFTIDGTTPTAASPVFDVPIQLEGRTTVKAYGERDGYTSSDMLVTDIDPNEERCAQPEYILADQMLTISTITDGAKVYYSLDGSEPTIPYSGAITLEQNGTVRAVALKDQYKPSEELQLVIDRFYTDLPIFTRTEGTLALSCYTPNVTLHYTTDGSEPTETSPVYTAPIDLTAISQVRAMAVAPGYNASSVVDYNVALEMQNMVNIDYSGQIFTLTATDGATIYYTTDGTNPTTASQQYLTPTAVDGLCTIRAIAVKEGSNNANESIFEVPAFFDGKTVTLRDAGALSQALGSNKAGLTELAVVGRINETDLATLRQETTALETLDLKNASTADHALPAGAFDNASFVSVSLPSDVQSTGNGLFTNCHNLAAVIWNAQTRIADEAFDGVQNPNLLLFVGAAGYAPASISNVIVGRQAQRITLTDGLTDGNFHSPRAFYAKQITYTHEYGMTTGIGKTQGWETLSVPFNVTRMSHATKGEILPFGAETAEDQQLPRFWLRELQSDGFAPATTIQAHMPYVVSMPNNPEYADRYCLNGSVTFEGQNVTVGITEPIAQNDGNGLSLISNFRHQEMAADILALNREKAEGFDEGSIFLPSNRDVQPFEAYVRTPGSQPVKLFEDIETGIEEVPAYMLRSNNRTTDGIYDLSGRQIGNSQLKKGIYIVNGKKVLK